MKKIKNKRDKNQKFFHYNFFTKNRKGWIKIVEAFTAILLVSGVLIVILGDIKTETQDTSLQVYDSEYSMLRDIQLDSSFRNSVLTVLENSLPVEWESFETAGLSGVKTNIESQIPSYLECKAKLCKISDLCSLSSAPANENIYVESIIISANSNVYNPRKLNLFCWVK